MMSISLKKIKLLSLLLLIFVITVVLLSYFFYKKTSKGVDCTSTFYIIPDNESWSYVKGTMSVTLLKNKNSGEVMFSGEAKNHDHLRRFERVISFNYENPEPSQYILSNILTRKYSNDDLQDSVFSDYIYSSSTSGNDHFVILKIRNAFLIGNMIGPRHLCVKRLR